MGLSNVEYEPGQSSCAVCGDIAQPGITRITGAEVVYPDLPPTVPVGDPDAVQLFLRRAGEDDMNIGKPVSEADAREFCSRDDTHGRGWFIGYDRK
jgi:hypothetical protein